MELFVESENIVNYKSKEYFKEVVNSYQNGNYRSAIVMLYCVTLFDLTTKLQELAEVYSDNVAEAILNEVRTILGEERKERWEGVIIERIHNETKLLDHMAYENLLYLKKWRNSSAHPSIDDDMQLRIPPKEVVAVCMRNSLNDILLRPAIFVKNIVEVMSNDLIEQSKTFGSAERLRLMLRKRYLDRMSDIMYVTTFRAFWKFAYRLNEDVHQQNRKLFHNVVKEMYYYKADIINSDIKNQSTKYLIGKYDKQIEAFIQLLACCPAIYPLVNIVVKNIVDTEIKNKFYYRLISWFLTSNSKEINIQTMTNSIIQDYEMYNGLPKLNEDDFTFVCERYKEDGLIDNLCSYFINLVGNAATYENGHWGMTNYIYPLLGYFNKENATKLIQIISTNSQFYGADRYIQSYCNTIWNAIKHYFNETERNELCERYPYFKIKM